MQGSVNVKRIAGKEEGNSLYPLPPDYYDLSAKGQRLARVNGLRQWLLHNEKGMEAKQRKAKAFVAAYRLFDSYYLRPEYDESGGIVFDPLFYDFPPAPPPLFRYELLAANVIYKSVVSVAPRGSTKSMTLAMKMMLQMLTRPAYSFFYATATNDLAESMGERIKFQLYENERIQDDWTPEYERLKPRRGEAAMGNAKFFLGNRSSFRATSAESKQRGGRPIEYVLDDPEHDARKSTSMEQIRDWMKVLLFSIITPMLQRSGAKLIWTGTYVSRRHYLHHAMEVNEVVLPDGSVRWESTDDRFDGWFRMEIPAAVEDPTTGKRKSCWPHMWPVDAEERDRLNLPEDQPTLETMERDMGTPVFMSEMMARPGEGGAAYFPALDKVRNGWWVEPATVDPAFTDRPFQSQAEICWCSFPSETVKRMPLSEFLGQCYTFMTVDHAYTENPSSDSKVATVIAYGFNNERFILDMFSSGDDPTKCPKHLFTKKIFDLASKWRVVSIHPELIRSGHSLAKELIDIISTNSIDIAGTEYMPTVAGFNPGMTEKVDKIASLWDGFNYGKIKLPFDGERPKRVHPWNRLVDQVEGFTPYAEDGGLGKDDEIDTLAMMTYVLRTPAPKKVVQTDKETAAPIELVRNGQLTDANGMPRIHSCLHQLTQADIDKLVYGVGDDKPRSQMKGVL